MGFLWNPWNVLTRKRRRKTEENDTFCVHRAYSLVVETFDPEKNGRKVYLTPLEAPFFIE